MMDPVAVAIILGLGCAFFAALGIITVVGVIRDILRWRKGEY